MPQIDEVGAVPWHLKPRLALGEIQCHPVAPFGIVPHWGCVLRCCHKCPTYPTPPEEQGTDEHAPTIRFHVYRNVTECTKHGILKTGVKTCEHCVAEGVAGSATGDTGTKAKGKTPKVRTRKHKTQLTRPIGIFHRDHYLPSLDKLAYHAWHVTMLGKQHCGTARAKATEDHRGPPRTLTPTGTTWSYGPACRTRCRQTSS